MNKIERELLEELDHKGLDIKNISFLVSPSCPNIHSILVKHDNEMVTLKVSLDEFSMKLRCIQYRHSSGLPQQPLRSG